MKPKTRNLRPIYDDNGELDDEAMQKQFEKLVGGWKRADEIQNLFDAQVEVFRLAARKQGFSDREIDAFLEL